MEKLVLLYRNVGSNITDEQVKNYLSDFSGETGYTFERTTNLLGYYEDDIGICGRKYNQWRIKYNRFVSKRGCMLDSLNGVDSLKYVIVTMPYELMLDSFNSKQIKILDEIYKEEMGYALPFEEDDLKW